MSVEWKREQASTQASLVSVGNTPYPVEEGELEAREVCGRRRGIPIEKWQSGAGSRFGLELID